MSATSADQGSSGIDVERQTQESSPGLESYQGHSSSSASTNFASSSFPDEAPDSTERPSTAIKIPEQTQTASSSFNSKSTPTQTPLEQPTPFLSQVAKKETRDSKQKSKQTSQPSSPTTTAPPSGPVLVNPGLPPPSTSSFRSAMHMPLSPHTLTRSHRPPKSQPQSLPQYPSSASFSFTSILSSLSSDPTTQSDIDAIAEICGRSRLSLANEYGAHRSPVGPGPDVRIGEEGNESEDDEMGPAEAQRLVLDTGGAAVYRSGGGLETVDEAPTPLSEGSRGHQIGDTYNSNSANASRSPTASAASDDATLSRWGFLDVWERGTRFGRGRPAGRSVLGLSGMDVEAVAESESFADQQRNPDLRDDISGAAGSRAVRQLMRVAGG